LPVATNYTGLNPNIARRVKNVKAKVPPIKPTRAIAVRGLSMYGFNLSNKKKNIPKVKVIK